MSSTGRGSAPPTLARSPHSVVTTPLDSLDKRKLSFPERLAVKAVKAPEGDFRDWDDIDAWALKIAGELATLGSDLGVDTRDDRLLPVQHNEEGHVLEAVQ